MKKSLFFVLLFLLVSFQAHAQEVKFKGFILRYNEAAAKEICFSVDVLDDKGNDLALCKDARATIVYVTTQCQCVLTATQKAAIYFVAHEPIPMPPRSIFNLTNHQ